MLDISDNSNTVFSTAHGRSPSPQLMPLLRKRTAHELVTGGRLPTTWSSTFFTPADSGTRVLEGTGKLGMLVRPMKVCCQLVIVGGAIAQPMVDILKRHGWPAVLPWAASNGRKWDLTTPEGRGYWQSLSLSGHVSLCIWLFDGWIDLGRTARCPEQAELAVDALLEGANNACKAASDSSVTIGFRGGAPIKITTLVRTPHIALIDVCTYDSHFWLESLVLFSNRSEVLTLARGCPSRNKSGSSALNHVHMHTPPFNRVRPLGPGFCHSAVCALAGPVQHLRSAGEWPSADRRADSPLAVSRRTGTVSSCPPAVPGFSGSLWS